jgi:hypothetical protein
MLLGAGSQKDSLSPTSPSCPLDNFSNILGQSARHNQNDTRLAKSSATRMNEINEPMGKEDKGRI